MSTAQYAEHLVRLKTERDVLEHRIANWRSKQMPAYRRAVEEKVRLDQEIERISLLLRKCKADSTESHSHEKTEPKSQHPHVRSQAIQAQSKQNDPDVSKRRTTVKNNPAASALELSSLFDRGKIPLPAKWKDAGFQLWSAAYRHPEYRKRIDVLISKDRKA